MNEAALPADATAEDVERPKRRLLVPLLTAGLVLALALAGVFAMLWQRDRETTTDEVGAFLANRIDDVEDVSQQVVTLLINYDSTNLQEQSAKVLPLATGSFREQYEQLLGQGLGDALEKATASSRGQILEGPDVTFKSPSEAVAILRTTQTTQSNENPGGRTFVYVMKLTLVDTTSGGWKADRVEILSQQAS
ncbi:MAG: hypothetical protein QOG54_2402 [Actinomycetota bacterium]|jgi:hypothetical protein|nr:hypothetical protein [Actinomycetota bacterium]